MTILSQYNITGLKVESRIQIPRNKQTPPAIVGLAVFLRYSDCFAYDSYGGSLRISRSEGFVHRYLLIQLARPHSYPRITLSQDLLRTLRRTLEYYVVTVQLHHVLLVANCGILFRLRSVCTFDQFFPFRPQTPHVDGHTWSRYPTRPS